MVHKALPLTSHQRYTIACQLQILLYVYHCTFLNILAISLLMNLRSIAFLVLMARNEVNS